VKGRPLDSAVSFHVARWSHRLQSAGLLYDCMLFFLSHAASRLDAPYQFAWTVFLSWMFVATAIVELETRRSALPVSRNPRAFRRFSHSQPIFFQSSARTPISVIW